MTAGESGRGGGATLRATHGRAPLTGPVPRCIFMCMRTTLILRDDLVRQASELTGVTEKTALVHAGLRALIARESARRLAALGGTDPALERPRRRRSEGRRP